jgi:hypothetical protein
MATQARVINEPPNQPPVVRSSTSPDPLGKQNLVPRTPVPAYDISARCVQFVALPGRTHKLQASLPARIHAAFDLVPAFAGCMVMISDQEARLVTVVTLWSGKERARHCNENCDCLKQLIAPFVDHWLRSESHLAHFAMLSPMDRKLQQNYQLPDGVSTLNPR